MVVGCFSALLVGYFHNVVFDNVDQDYIPFIHLWDYQSFALFFFRTTVLLVSSCISLNHDIFSCGTSNLLSATTRSSKSRLFLKNSQQESWYNLSWNTYGTRNIILILLLYVSYVIWNVLSIALVIWNWFLIILSHLFIFHDDIGLIENLVHHFSS